MTARRSCCNATPSIDETDAEKIKGYVRETYASLARRPETSPCCDVAKQLGYSEAQLEGIPDTARLVAAGCGNPTALAGLKPGEVVLDLGSGGGIDVLVAARVVAPSGRVIGVDMTPEMVTKARENAAKMGLENVEFKLGEIEALPVEDGDVDVVISNCVINLSPDKGKVFKEAYRVLKKGGRLLVSDMMAEGLPDALRRNSGAYAACIAGAIGLPEYLDAIRNAGFSRVRVVDQQEYPRELVEGFARGLLGQGCCGPSESEETQERNRPVDLTGLKVLHAEVEAWKLEP